MSKKRARKRKNNKQTVVNEEKTVVNEEKTVVNEEKTVVNEEKTVVNEEKTVKEIQIIDINRHNNKSCITDRKTIKLNNKNIKYDIITTVKDIKTKVINLFIALVAIALVIMLIIKIGESNQLKTTGLDNVEYTGNIISVDTSENNTEIITNVEYISIKKDNHYINMKKPFWLDNMIGLKQNKYTIDNKEYTIDKEVKLNKFIVNDKMVYEEYINKEKTANKEFILAADKPSELDLKEVSKINSRFYEKSNPIQIKTYCNSYDNTFLMINETLSGGALVDETLQGTLKNLEKTLTYSSCSENSISDITIKINEIGDIHLKDIDEVKGFSEVTYDNDKNTLNIRNYNEDITYITISSINNEYVGCFAEDLIETTNPRLFIHKNYDKQGDIGYKTFAVISDNKLICFKVNELSQESLINNIFNQLGFKDNNIEVKKIQKAIDKTS